MSIISITTSVTGQVGVSPAISHMVCTDDLDTVTSENFLASAQSNGYVFNDGDIVAVMYSYGNSPTTQFFTVSKTSTTITLVPSSNGVVLPVVAGNFAVFGNTNGAIDDAGFAPTDTEKTKVVMMDGASVVGNLTKFSDTAGTIEDSGYSPTNAAKTKVVMANGAVGIGNLPIFVDTAGTIDDIGAGLLTGVTELWAGGSTTHVFSAPGLTSNSVGSSSIRSCTNSCSIIKEIPGTDNITVVFTADPGADTAIAYVYTTIATND